MPDTPPLQQHYAPKGFRDRAAHAFVKFLRFFAEVAIPFKHIQLTCRE